MTSTILPVMAVWANPATLNILSLNPPAHGVSFPTLALFGVCALLDPGAVEVCVSAASVWALAIVVGFLAGADIPVWTGVIWCMFVAMLCTLQSWRSDSWWKQSMLLKLSAARQQVGLVLRWFSGIL